MNLKLRSVAGKGVAEEERLVIDVLRECELGEYAVFHTGFSVETGNVDIGVSNTFWFPNKEVRNGDLVVLYTKRGRSSEKALENGRKAYFFYWEKTGPLWSADDKAAVLLHAPEWEAKGAGSL
ncbi:hypothetical protein [Roseateles sp.]|uniref:hypothetical protein n=1 Tax=Roseateles sp. TaxID=1971397 RepID=UPI003BA809D6